MAKKTSPMISKPSSKGGKNAKVVAEKSASKGKSNVPNKKGKGY